MVRIAWMNLILHDLESPEVHQLDALSKRLDADQSGTYDIILANPPFTGSVDEGDLSEIRERFPHVGKGKNSSPITTKSELLFVWLMLDLLKIGGRAAVIVPDGVLFGSTNAHRALRRQLLFENTLEAVISLPANMFQPYSGVKTSIIVFQKAADKRPAGEPPRTREVWFYEVTDEAYTLDQKRKARPGQDNDLWDALEKFKAWTRYREGEAEDKKGKTLAAAKADAIATHYHQPGYWEERWRTIDNEFLKLFPDKAGDKGHIYPLHEIWPTLFHEPDETGGSREYEEVLLPKIRNTFEQAMRHLIVTTVYHFAGPTGKISDSEKLRLECEKNMKAVFTALTREARDAALLDRDFDQFGANALKTMIREMTAAIPEWVKAASVPVTQKAVRTRLAAFGKPDVSKATDSLIPVLKEFAKLDGYNVWRRTLELYHIEGKLIASDDGSEAKRVPTQLSWIVPVRQWSERETWGEDPKTKQPIAKPTHRNGAPDPKYLDWLRDTLKVFDTTDGTVKKEFIDLGYLDPECLEALDFNLSAGRHKPFIFDAGQHRPPAELITELQALHAEVQQRLGNLLSMVGGAK